MPDSVFTMMDTNAWTGDLVLGALPWADMTIEDAIYTLKEPA